MDSVRDELRTEIANARERAARRRERYGWDDKGAAELELAAAQSHALLLGILGENGAQEDESELFL